MSYTKTWFGNPGTTGVFISSLFCFLGILLLIYVGNAIDPWRGNLIKTLLLFIIPVLFFYVVGPGRGLQSISKLSLTILLFSLFVAILLAITNFIYISYIDPSYPDRLAEAQQPFWEKNGYTKEVIATQYENSS